MTRAEFQRDNAEVNRAWFESFFDVENIYNEAKLRLFYQL